MKRILYENGLSITMLGLFLVFLVGQVIAGRAHYNDEQTAHGEAPVGYAAYLRSGEFIEATFENWESEFLQMACFVLFTVFLRQKGSPESKKLHGKEPVDADPRRNRRSDAPWPVRRGGWILALYEYSLSLALGCLFLISFALHAYGSLRENNDERVLHGEPALGLGAHLASPDFWFESFQNWQSEFLSVGVLVVLSVFLRQRGSPESKPVHHPHFETGGA